MFTACPIVFSYFIKLGIVFAIWKVPPAAYSNGKSNIQFQNKINWQQCTGEQS